MTVEELQKHYDALLDVLTDHMRTQDKLLADMTDEAKRWRDMYYDLKREVERAEE